jgi:hypothetical protein
MNVTDRSNRIWRCTFPSRTGTRHAEELAVGVRLCHQQPAYLGHHHAGQAGRTPLCSSASAGPHPAPASSPLPAGSTLRDRVAATVPVSKAMTSSAMVARVQRCALTSRSGSRASRMRANPPSRPPATLRSRTAASLPHLCRLPLRPRMGPNSSTLKHERRWAESLLHRWLIRFLSPSSRPVPLATSVISMPQPDRLSRSVTSCQSCLS